MNIGIEIGSTRRARSPESPDFARSTCLYHPTNPSQCSRTGSEGVGTSSPGRYTRHNPPEGRRIAISSHSTRQDDSHDTGDSPVRRFAMTALTLSLMLGLSLAQEPKKDEPKAEAKPADAPKPRSDAKPGRSQGRAKDAPKEPPRRRPSPRRGADPDRPARGRGQAGGRPPRHRRPDRRGAGRRAGRDLDRPAAGPRPPGPGLRHRPRDLKATPKRGVSPEVFAAWFTGFGKPRPRTVNYEADVRIVPPSKGLKTYYDTPAPLF